MYILIYMSIYIYMHMQPLHRANDFHCQFTLADYTDPNKVAASSGKKVGVEGEPK